MRYVLILLSFMFVTTFGAITLVESYTPASAGPVADNAPDDADDDDIYDQCHDDGDDGENPGVVDDPDNEDYNEEDGEEIGDYKEDPNYEDDDEPRCRIIATASITPAPTPCPSIIQNGADNECCITGPGSVGDVTGEGFLCLCPDSAGGEVVAEGNCFCIEGGQPFGCLCDLGDAPDCCVYQGGCQVNVETAPADADCDGEVTPQDAYETLVVLSGFQSSAGSDCAGGDADCSEDMDAKDTLTILAVVAGLEEPATC